MFFFLIKTSVCKLKQIRYSKQVVSKSRKMNYSVLSIDLVYKEIDFDHVLLIDHFPKEIDFNLALLIEHSPK